MKPASDRCQDAIVIGRAILDHINAGRVQLLPGVAELNENGVRFTDGTEWVGDAVILATGYRAAIEWMGGYGARDGCGFADRRDRVRSMNHPDLYFIGHNYDGRGGLYNIRIDANRIRTPCRTQVTASGSRRTPIARLPGPCETRSEWCAEPP